MGPEAGLDIGVNVQTSEISKIGLILILAGYLSGTGESRLTRGQFLSMCLLTALPLVLIIIAGGFGHGSGVSSHPLRNRCCGGLVEQNPDLDHYPGSASGAAAVVFSGGLSHC